MSGRELMDLLNMVRGFKDAGSYESRKVDRTAVGGLVVSTAYTSDMGYETALLTKTKTIIVERYPGREHAVRGHAKWCMKVVGMRSVTALGYGSLVEDEKVKLDRMTKKEAKELEGAV